MHIPDGYLSPLTCAVTYALVLPFWMLAFARVKRLLHTSLVPRLAVFSAFSFVIMMFNIPLPGGTTGHAVGMAIAAIILGPWAGIVAISIALLIQALFFGDGGITTFGANCLNMAVVGCWVAYWAYRLIAGRAEIDSIRRLVAAGVSGYLAINMAALLTAIEFGIQPLFFHDASGTPLYAPYPLSIAVPAMMIGHLSFAGLAEIVITVSLFAWLQRTQSSLLKASFMSSACQSGWRSVRSLGYVLTLLMLLSPLGLLASGTAWGEWDTDYFASAESWLAILHASGQEVPPDSLPQGLARLANLWSAPIPDYAPEFISNSQVGYILAAIVGCGLILLSGWLASRLSGKKAVALK